MKSIAIKILVNGVALWVAAFLLKGIHLGAGGTGLNSQFVTILWVAVIFGLVNAVIKPVLKFFAMPVIILTLGLFSLVVNAAMLELTSWFAVQFGLDFRVDQFFWDAVLGSIIITFVSMILNKILPDGGN
ncbi:MAG: phage holin family protein [Dermatophilaceae bacterium]